MKIWIVYHNENRDTGEGWNLSVDYDVESLHYLELIYKDACRFCEEKNRNKDFEGSEWSWKLAIGDSEEKVIDPMLFMQLYEIAEDITKFWKENGGKAKPYLP